MTLSARTHRCQFVVTLKDFANVALIFNSKEDIRIRIADKSSRVVQIRDKTEEGTSNKTERCPFTNYGTFVSLCYICDVIYEKLQD
jgi:hypothetical protein